MKTTTFARSGGLLQVTELGNGRRHLRAEPEDTGGYCQNPEWETSYSPELIIKILDIKGVQWVCDEILREENPSAIRGKMMRNLFNYFAPGDFQDKRMLDFGCGCGASTMNLARLLPDTSICGAELHPGCLSAAKARAAFYGFDKIAFFASPSPTELPSGTGTFDFINLNAVYEHFLPAERRTLLPSLWRLLNPGGALLVSETPFRWSLYEYHTTGLPLVNFFPDWLLARTARLLSKRVTESESWEKLLRDGIRGATPEEIMHILQKHSCKPIMLTPSGAYLNGRIEPWPVPADQLDAFCRFPMRGKNAAVGKTCITILKVLRRIFRFPDAADLSFAVKKPF